MKQINPDTLLPHPYNARLYRQRTPSNRFIEDISEQMEEPLVINEDGEIIDGVRRWLAVLELGWDSIEVIEKSYSSVEAEQKAILRHNDDRDETFSQKMRVALEYEKLIAPKLEKRMKAGKSLDEQDEDPILNSDEGATTLKIVGDRVDWGKSKYRQAKAIWEAKESGDKQAKRLVSKLDEGDTSVNGAYEKLEESGEGGTIPDTRGKAAPKEVAKEKINIDEPVRAAFPTTVYRFKQLLNRVRPVRGRASENEADLRLEIYDEEVQVHTIDSRYGFSDLWFGGIHINIDEGPLWIYIKHSDLDNRIDLLDGNLRVEIRGQEGSEVASHIVLADSEKTLILSNLSEYVSRDGPTIVRQEQLEDSPLSEDSS